ncbi:Bug family tripartite tricarboxylate transporter substrate binding protein [Rhodoferax sediminis]|uniref:Tripartite tricarboxylate transporter substrate binding protein n=1 Tax=Rhodoferax sediminis TaxID=2509614 RepID=A0A515DE04_9BURK|nr:tripartite tricarboxylate transporter substrate binding protein [Rhodoferax sediminis]QDL38619.1 tripartite tricarboxylate transporter substrate binding protein [Rhodoferax sediminis]
MKNAIVRTLGLLAALALPLSPVVAQEPAPPLHLVVPYSAGGTTDALARLLQKSLADVLKRTVIVDNKPGASGTIGTEFVARAAPDGNTIVFGNQGPNAIVPAVRKTPYDPINDLRPLTTVAFMPLVLTVPAERGPKTLKEFMAQARRPGAKMNYGSSGIGSFAHLTGYEFARLGNLDLTHVPYKGGAGVVTALLAGDIQGSFLTAMEATPLMQSGKMRVLAVGSPKRVATLPDVPAVAEEIPGFDSVIWFAVFAPKGTSDEIAEKLRAAVVQAVNRPEYQNYLAQRNSEGRTTTPQELTDIIRHDMQHWGDVVRRGNIPM